MTITGRLRRRLLAPTEDDVGFAVRGFPVSPGPTTRELERIPRAVVRGFRAAIDGSGTREVAARAGDEPALLRGFFYEGAVMASCVVDAIDPRGGTRARELLVGPGRPHILLGWIGVGFAMARLPRGAWSRAVPDLSDVEHQDTMSWLAVDGYAFDLAYFDHRRRLPGASLRPLTWRGETDYAPRAGDQGFGRALWFVHGAQAGAVAEAVGRHAPGRHADLWAGVGLAASLAGGASPRALASLRRRAGDHGIELGLGAVFASVAASESGCVPDHTHVAASELAGLTVEQAVALATRAAPGVAPSAQSPAGPEYEQWRARIRAALNPETRETSCDPFARFAGAS